MGSKRWCYLTAGLVLVGLAMLGIFLPLLPTTPLVLLAAVCFSRSSERCHQWLLNHRLFGSITQSWQTNRCIPLKSKIIALLLVAIFGGYAVVFVAELLWLRIVIALFLLAGVVSICRIPSCRKFSQRHEDTMIHF